MRNLLRFLVSRIFIINLVIAGALVSGIVYVAFGYLDDYTHHGETITVPDFQGMHIDELDEFVKKHDLQYQIIDSVYDIHAAKGTVMDQNPPADFQVKQNRKVYLTVIARMPEMAGVPKLQDATAKEAMLLLKQYGFEVGEVIPKPSSKCAGCLLNLERNGEKVEPGTMLPKGTKLDLVVGEQGNAEMSAVPVLLAQTLGAAEELLQERTLNLGAVVYDKDTPCETREDSLQARIYRQIPMYGEDKVIEMGGAIAVFCSCDPAKVMTVVPDSVLKLHNLIQNSDSTVEGIHRPE